VHYSSLCWLPLTFLSAYAIESMTNKVFKLKVIYTILITFIGLIISAIVFAIPYMLMYHKDILIQNIKDDFAVSNIAANVHWTWFDTLPSLLLAIGIIAFIFLKINGNKSTTQYSVLLISVILFVTSTSIILVPKVEQHTQNAIITFLKSKQKENCYIHNVGYKTYAIYFYAQTKPLKFMDGLNMVREKYFREKSVKNYLQLNEKERNELDSIERNWLMNNEQIDKPTYFIAKINYQQDLDKNKRLKLILNQNGFVVYQRQ
jgi:hypothetical protein